MYWKGRRQSNNIEDRRGTATKGVIGGGIGTIIVVLLFALLGGNPSAILDQISIPNSEYANDYQETEEEKELVEFVSVVLAEIEDVWTAIFKENGREYILPRLVLYSGFVDSACGMAGSSTGPFYCPGDYRVYIDLSFFNELQHRFQAPGDFAIAYVIAHEVGHHVQNLLGIYR
jgi:predicted metalloprotease